MKGLPGGIEAGNSLSSGSSNLINHFVSKGTGKDGRALTREAHRQLDASGEQPEGLHIDQRNPRRPVP